VLPRSRGTSGWEELVKEQLNLAAFFNVTLTESDEMTLPEFESVRRVARQLSEEAKGAGQLPLSPGAVGRARIL